jgi:putative PIN family toxin of toxin-antitoxin system
VRLVLDTDVLIAAVRSPTGASAALLLAAAEGAVTLLVSVPLAFEYEATCSVPEHRIVGGLDKSQLQLFLDGVIAIAEKVETRFLWRPRLRDPADEMVLETAVNGGADAIVSFKIRDFGTAPAESGIAVLRPAEALKRMRQ